MNEITELKPKNHRQFVTLCDESYLAQVSVMWNSLLQHAPESSLVLVCVTERTYEISKVLGLKNYEPVHPRIYDDPVLSSLRRTRSRKEFCWTLTPTAILTAFKVCPQAAEITYLDADLFFVKSPEPIFEELDNAAKSVLITEHGFHPSWDKSKTSGPFNVQFITVRRETGLSVILDWDAKCREWCSDVHQGGLIGDQGYLTTWPKDYPTVVHVALRTEYFQGPWNARVFKSTDAITYHMHGVKLDYRGIVLKGSYPISRARERTFYTPYSKRIRKTFVEFPEIPIPPPQPARLVLLGRLREAKSRAKNLLSAFWYEYLERHKANPSISP